MQIRIGISGWRYPPWRGVFYPKDWPQWQEFTMRRRNSWAHKIRHWSKHRDVVAYFDNDVKVKAPYDAQRLLMKLTDFKPEKILTPPKTSRLNAEKILGSNRERWPYGQPKEGAHSLQ